jgi:hypothetical protein
VFANEGALIPLGKYLEGAGWVAARSGTITNVWIYRREAGGSGTTICDVNLNGVTIFTVQANRPTISSAQGNNAVSQSGAFQVSSFVAGDWIEVQLDDKENGNPKDVTVVVEVIYA